MANDIRPILQSRINNLNRLIDVKSRDLKVAPIGRIIISSCHGKHQFRILNGKNRIYIPFSDKERISLMAQKLYDQKVLDAAIIERDLIEQLLQRLGTSPEIVIDNVAPLLKPYIKPVLLSDKEYVQQWETTEFIRKEPMKNSPFVTKKGEVVRSKSELLIADRLNDMNIPYRYEAELILGSYILHPDFTILDVKHRREVYFEHLGRMDDLGYVKDNMDRLNIYQRNNIILGDRLFISMETIRYPLDLTYITNSLARFARDSQ